MKKNLYTLLLAFIALPMLLTSCDEDVEIGMSLEGTWEGRMYMRYYSKYDRVWYESTKSQIDFCADPFRSTSGTGYWMDHFSGDAPWEYYLDRFDWWVSNGVIYIEFRERNFDGSRYKMAIRNFRINDEHFTGYFFDENDTRVDFNLYKVASPTWDRYHSGWNYWDGYARKTRSNDAQADGDTIQVPFEYPVRHCIKND